jgi:cytoskeleton protein RodZ
MLLGFIVAVVALVYAGLWVIERISDLDGSEQAAMSEIRIPQATNNEPADDAESDTSGGTALPVQLPSAAGDFEDMEDSPGGEPPVAVAVTTKQLTFRFNNESWVEAYDAQGTRLIYEMGTAGSQRTLTGEPPMEIFLGFADGVEILVDGEPFALQNARRRGNTAQITIERDQ